MTGLQMQRILARRNLFLSRWKELALEKWILRRLIMAEGLNDATISDRAFENIFKHPSKC